MCSAARARALTRAGSPIRKSAGRRLFAPHRSLSQLATSFLDVLCQGIHRVPSTSSSHAPPRGDPSGRRLRSCQSVSAYRPGSPRALILNDRREYSTSRLISCLLFAFPLCACQGAADRAALPRAGRPEDRMPAALRRGASGPRASPRSRSRRTWTRPPAGEAKPRAPSGVLAPGKGVSP